MSSDCTTVLCELARIADAVTAPNIWADLAPAISVLSVLVTSLLAILLPRRERTRARQRRVIDAWSLAIAEVEHLVLGVKWDDLEKVATMQREVHRVVARADMSAVDESGWERGLGTVIHLHLQNVASEAGTDAEANQAIEKARSALLAWARRDRRALKKEFGTWPRDVRKQFAS